MDEKNLHNSELNFENLPEPRVPADAAWADMKKMLKPAPSQTIPGKTGKVLSGGPFLYAGMGLLIVAAIFYSLLKKEKQKEPIPIIYYSQDKPQRDTLENGTEVFLNTYSNIGRQLKSGEENTLSINGAAYVRNIRGTQLLPHLKIGNLDILPAKAAIYVSYDSTSNISAVHIQSGTAIIEAEGKRVTLSAGESIRYDEKKKLLSSKQPVNINLYGYATNIFEFTNTPLKEATGVIEKAYGVTTLFENTKLYNCRITTRFDNKSLNEMLDIMAYTLNFDYKLDEKNKQVILRGNGCD